MFWVVARRLLGCSGWVARVLLGGCQGVLGVARGVLGGC